MGEIDTYDWRNEVILVAEDDEFNYLLLKKILGLTKARTIYTSNGKEAFDLLISNKDITVAVLDLVMPFMNGFDIVKKCKSILPDVIFIAYTADVVRYDRKKCIEAGFSVYIPKPVLPVKFLRFLNNALLLRSHLSGK